MSIAIKVREKETESIYRNNYLQLLFESFFNEFLLYFFPELHQMIDLNILLPVSVPIEISNQNKLTIFQTKVKGNDAIIFIQIANDKEDREKIENQMYQTFLSLNQRYETIIIPIMVLIGEKTWDKNEYHVSCSNWNMVTFRYLCAEVNKENFPQYLQENNVIAVALLYHELELSEIERFELQTEILKMMIHMHGNEAETRPIYKYFKR